MENLTNLSIMERVMLVAENEVLFNRRDVFKDAQYIVVIKKKQTEAS